MGSCSGHLHSEVEVLPRGAGGLVPSRVFAIVHQPHPGVASGEHRDLTVGSP